MKWDIRNAKHVPRSCPNTARLATALELTGLSG
jgi:hypothetical protein